MQMKLDSFPSHEKERVKTEAKTGIAVSLKYEDCQTA